jgi:O-antigen ligase
MDSEHTVTRPTVAQTGLNLVHRFSLIGVISIAFFLLVFQAQAVFIKVGPFSLSVYATVLAAGLVLVSCTTQLLLGSYIKPRAIPRRLKAESLRLLRILWPLILLLVFSSIWLALEWRIEGAQNLLALTILVVGILALANETDSQKVKRFLSLYLHVSLVVSGVYVVFTVSGLPGFANRQFAMIMLVSLSIAAVWPASNRLLRAAPYVFAFSIVLSQSRAAALVALVLLAIHLFWSTRGTWKLWSRITATLIAVGGVLVLALVAPPWIEAWTGIDWGIEYRDLSGTSGRFTAWARFLALLTRPSEWIFGLGTGAAMEYGTAEVPYFSHPHNEYLRFLVDLGILGVVLLIIGALLLIIHFTRSWSSAEPVGKAALLVIISLGIVATTDGPLYSSFVIIPATLVIGLGLASTLSTRWSPEKQRAKKDS